jgi:spermidine synthase
VKRLLHLFFFASGATALIYQVAWVSILKIDFGTTVHAVSTALTIFMAGLALGSAWVGRIVDRGARPLAVYAALEAALGVWSALFALSVPAWHALSARLLSGTTLSVGSSAPIQLLLAAAVLLPPAVCMGGTLPALAKAITESPAVRGARLARLYGINTLGAVAGCLLEAFVLVPTVGVRASILLAAAINLGLGAAAFALARRAPAAETAAAPAADIAAAPTERAPVALALTLAFLSGFLTLAAEVLWTRLAINLLTANVLVFAALLAGFLAGLGAGALLVARRADRLPRPDRRWRAGCSPRRCAWSPRSSPSAASDTSSTPCCAPASSGRRRARCSPWRCSRSSSPCRPRSSARCCRCCSGGAPARWRRWARMSAGSTPGTRWAASRARCSRASC